jgi:hypothetical protein
VSADGVMLAIVLVGVVLVGVGFAFDSILVAASGCLMCFAMAFAIGSNAKHAEEIQACRDVGMHAITREIPVGTRFVACVEIEP